MTQGWVMLKRTKIVGTRTHCIYTKGTYVILNVLVILIALENPSLGKSKIG